MSILVEMIKDTLKEDFDKHVRPVASGVKEATLGLLEGLYTPFLISTGSRRIDKALESDRDLKAAVQTGIAILMGASAIWGTVIYNLSSEGEKWKESLGAFGVIVATNVIDYFVNVYKKARHLDELYRRQKPGWHLTK